MKYIRTKDRVYDASLFLREYTGWYFNERTKLYAFTENEIIKQADNIEELCDEFVGIDSQGHYIIHNDEFIKGAKIVPLEKVSYYGAIWTDKGLIYVAKMNEKGELELL